MIGTVYLIPSVIDDAATATIPLYVIDAIKKCDVIFAENERTTRRYLKSIYKEIVIDNYEWFAIHKTEEQQTGEFISKLKAGKNIAIVSEAGCPGIADPGQILILEAQKLKAKVVPLVGPSSILLALMASGLSGQQFQFVGYLPIDNNERSKAIKDLENESSKKRSTQIFIETPYRNQQMFDAILKNCKGGTWLCIAAEITAASEYIKTMRIDQWKNEKPDLHKKPVIFLLYAG